MIEFLNFLLSLQNYPRALHVFLGLCMSTIYITREYEDILNVFPEKIFEILILRVSKPNPPLPLPKLGFWSLKVLNFFFLGHVAPNLLLLLKIDGNKYIISKIPFNSKVECLLIKVIILQSWRIMTLIDNSNLNFWSFSVN